MLMTASSWSVFGSKFKSHMPYHMCWSYWNNCWNNKTQKLQLDLHACFHGKVSVFMFFQFSAISKAMLLLSVPSQYGISYFHPSHTLGMVGTFFLFLLDEISLNWIHSVLGSSRSFKLKLHLQVGWFPTKNLNISRE